MMADKHFLSMVSVSDRDEHLAEAFEMMVERLTNIEQKLDIAARVERCKVDTAPTGTRIPTQMFIEEDWVLEKNYGGAAKDRLLVIHVDSGTWDSAHHVLEAWRQGKDAVKAVETACEARIGHDRLHDLKLRLGRDYERIEECCFYTWEVFRSNECPTDMPHKFIYDWVWEATIRHQVPEITAFASEWGGLLVGVKLPQQKGDTALESALEVTRKVAGAVGRHDNVTKIKIYAVDGWAEKLVLAGIRRNENAAALAFDAIEWTSSTASAAREMFGLEVWQEGLLEALARTERLTASFCRRFRLPRALVSCYNLVEDNMD